jgi:hypothetical protein
VLVWLGVNPDIFFRGDEKDAPGVQPA